jgi:hypothetical protein
MVLSLLAYFFSMVTAFAIVMMALVGFGDSQLRATRLPHSAVSVIAGSDRDALTNADKAKEAQKAAEARKAAEAQRAATEARENAKKVARAKLARERKQAAVARQQQEREARDNALAWGSPGQYSGGGLYSYAPGFGR